MAIWPPMERLAKTSRTGSTRPSSRPVITADAVRSNLSIDRLIIDPETGKLAVMQETARKAGRPAVPIARSELLARARREFARRGYRATSLSRIAEATGLRKASLFHHFRSKEELYLEMMNQVLEELVGLVDRARLDEGGFAERLDRLGATVVEHLAAHPSAARLLLLELAGQGPFLQGPGRQRAVAGLQLTSAFLRAGMDAGVFRQQDPDQLALSIIGLHLLYFAGPELVGRMLEDDALSPTLVARRRDELIQQVRGLCL
jgi:AcrR family transcriptional regulator